MPDKLGQKGARIFTCSLSDFYIEEADEWRAEAMRIIERNPQHVFLILTKRVDRAPRELPDNVWLGVSVEGEKYVHRIDKLYKVKARRRFVSFEPLISQVLTNNLWEIDWAIVGGESGPGCRPMQLEWARRLRDYCFETGTAFFMKQLGGPHYKKDMMRDFPEDLRIRQYP